MPQVRGKTGVQPRHGRGGSSCRPTTAFEWCRGWAGERKRGVRGGRRRRVRTASAVRGARWCIASGRASAACAAGQCVCGGRNGGARVSPRGGGRVNRGARERVWRRHAAAPAARRHPPPPPSPRRHRVCMRVAGRSEKRCAGRGRRYRRGRCWRSPTVRDTGGAAVPWEMTVVGPPARGAADAVADAAVAAVAAAAVTAAAVATTAAAVAAGALGVWRPFPPPR